MYINLFFYALLSPFVKICKCKQIRYVPRNLIFLCSILKLLYIIIVLRSSLTVRNNSHLVYRNILVDWTLHVLYGQIILNASVCFFKSFFFLSYLNKYLTSMSCKFTCIISRTCKIYVIRHTCTCSSRVRHASSTNYNKILSLEIKGGGYRLL